MSKQLNLRNLSIKTKLLSSLLLVGILSIVVIGWQGYQSGKSSLRQSSFNQLTSVRATKARQIESYFEQIRKQVLTFSENRMIIDAMKEFKASFHTVIEANEVSESELAGMETSVRRYYEQEYLTRLNPNVDYTTGVDKYWPGEAQTTYLQYHYLSIIRIPPAQKIILNSREMAANIVRFMPGIIRLFGITLKSLVTTIFS